MNKALTVVAAAAFSLSAGGWNAASAQGVSDDGRSTVNERDDAASVGRVEAGRRPVDRSLLDVSPEWLRDRDVIGMEGEEIGDIEELVRPANAAGNETYAVVSIDNGWFEAERRVLVPLDQFSISEDGGLRVEGLTEDTAEALTEYEDETAYGPLEGYETIGDAYDDGLF